MTNFKTISSLVNFYTTELQNTNSKSDVSKKLPSLASQSTPSHSDREYFQYIKGDIQSIVCDVLDVDKTYLYMYGDRELDANIISQIDKKITSYKGGEPLAHILGYKYFWDQKLKVTQDTLIPRADTEVLVQAVLDDVLNANHSREGGCFELSILDLGTGTGAIALALASELPNARVVAVDYSIKALEVARENAISNDVVNVEFVQSDWYRNLKDRRFDVIVSNPPYIDSSDNDIDVEVKVYEPATALFSDDNGIADMGMIISQAKDFLKANGSLYIEHGYTQAASVQEVFQKNGFVNVETIRDLSGKDRCTRTIKKSSDNG